MKRLLLSFRYAVAGLVLMLRTERNARIDAAATVVVVLLAVSLKVDAQGWCWLATAITMVWCAEAFNTAIERLADRVSKEREAAIGQVKDLAAGATLCASAGAVVIGLVVLGPRLWAALAA